MYRNGLRICVPITLNVCTEHTGLIYKILSMTHRKLLLAFRFNLFLINNSFEQLVLNLYSLGMRTLTKFQGEQFL